MVTRWLQDLQISQFHVTMSNSKELARGVGVA